MSNPNATNHRMMLLDPKKFKKSKDVFDKDSTRSQDGSVDSDGLGQSDSRSKSRLPSNQSSLSNMNPISPTKRYDPSTLLNPKGIIKRPTEIRGSLSPFAPTHQRDESVSSIENPEFTGKLSTGSNDHGRKSMLEGLYGVERRTEQPRKRAKTSLEDKDLSIANKSAYANRSSGVVGEYLKPTPDDLTNNIPIISTTVDLTNEDDEDELQITGSRKIFQEVCFGMISGNVQSHIIPKPATQSVFLTANDWPVIKCRLKRRTSKDTVIDVLDPSDKPFGKIVAEIANPLSQAIDGLWNFNTQARLVNRRKKTGEYPHQPCSETMRIVINIYGHKSDAEKVGKLFGQHNLWLRNPMASKAGVPIVNPHQKKKSAITIQPTRRNITSDTRTVEEATEAVSKLFDHFASTSNPLIPTEPPSIIKTSLLDHQKQALTFLLEHERPRTFGPQEADNSSLWREEINKKGIKTYREVVSGITLDKEPDQVYGGLLADVMGLGKTLEALALITATLEEGVRFGAEKVDRSDQDEIPVLVHTKATLLVSPLSAIKNWEDQIAEHIDSECLTYHVYHGPNRSQNAFELCKYDIIITTYGTIAAEFNNKTSRLRISPLRQVKWFRIVLDEAHTIRESRASQSQAIYSLKAQRRWCLTGTPIQNRIDDLGSLTRFLRLFPYDTPGRFTQYIRSPALAQDPSFLKALRVFVDSFTLRRLRDRVDLPSRQDFVVTLEFSPEEKTLHDFFKEISHVQIEELTKKKQAKSGIQHHVLQSIMTLRLICAHGRELLKEKDLQKLKGISLNDAIDLDEEPRLKILTKREAFEAYSLMADASLDTCRQCDRSLSDDSPQVDADSENNNIRCHVLPCMDVICDDCFGPYKANFAVHPESEPMACPFCNLFIATQHVPITPNTAEELEAVPSEPALPTEQETFQFPGYGGPHTKTLALLDEIDALNKDSIPLVDKREPPLKCVVFSEFTSHLDLIGRALQDNNHTFVRIDGTMTLSKRKKVLDAFSTDDSVTILLASIKAAGQGLNLTAASRAFIMEPMWNPAAEAQAVDRIYRIGQTREVVIKRYQMKESIEGKIVELQKRKQALADVSMNRNHSQLSKKEIREQHMKDILALFK